MTRVVCLLPARNAADDLPGWSTSTGPFADSVIAPNDAAVIHERVDRDVHRWGTRGLRLRYWSALLLIVLAALSSWIGTCHEIAVTAAQRGRSGRRGR